MITSAWCGEAAALPVPSQTGWSCAPLPGRRHPATRAAARAAPRPVPAPAAGNGGGPHRPGGGGPWRTARPARLVRPRGIQPGRAPRAARYQPPHPPPPLARRPADNAARPGCRPAKAARTPPRCPPRRSQHVLEFLADHGAEYPQPCHPFVSTPGRSACGIGREQVNATGSSAKMIKVGRCAHGGSRSQPRSWHRRCSARRPSPAADRGGLRHARSGQAACACEAANCRPRGCLRHTGTPQRSDRDCSCPGN